MLSLPRLLDQIKTQSSIYSKFLTLCGGTAFSQVIGILSLPFVTRLYTPEDIGIVSLFLSFFGFWVAAICLRYEQALFLSNDDFELIVVRRLATYFVFIMSLVGISLLHFMQFKNFFNFELLPVWAPVLSFPIFCGYGLYMIYRSLALRAGQVSLVGQTAVIRSSVLALSKLTFGLCGLGVVGLFLSELAGAISSLPNLRRSVNRNFSSYKPVFIAFSQLRAVSLKYAKFSTLETPSAWLDALSMMLPLPMVAGLYGAESAGWFGLARMAVSLPNAQIGGAVGDVFQMSLSKAVRNKDFQRSREVLYFLAKKLSLIGLIPLIGSIVFLPWLFPVVFGKSWEQAGIISAILAIWMYSAFIVSPLSRVLSVLQAQEWKLIYDCFVLALLITSYFVAEFYQLNLFQFCWLIALSNVLAYLVYAFVLYILIERRLTIH